MYNEVNTGNNLPAQIDIYATDGNEYEFLFLAKGGGSANKTFLFQESKALLNPTSLHNFLNEKLRSIGTLGTQALKSVDFPKSLSTISSCGCHWWYICRISDEDSEIS